MFYLPVEKEMVTGLGSGALRVLLSAAASAQRHQPLTINALQTFEWF
jgi:hypothetical protein